MINHPIIAKFSTYEVRDLVFRSKRKLKDPGHAVFESLITHCTKLYNEVKSIAGYKNAWTHDGQVMTIQSLKSLWNRFPLLFYAAFFIQS